MQAFRESYDRYLSSDLMLIVWVSGGVDSVSLLHLLIAIHPREKIIVAHYDHGLRAEASLSDAEFVRELAYSYGVMYRSERADIWSLAHTEGEGIEATARKYRYWFLERVAREYDHGVILTAHHLDDRIETMFHHLLRGTKLRGLMSLSDTQVLPSGVRLIRPLLEIPKTTLIAYAREHWLTSVEDATNTSLDYTRNRLRHEVLSACESINPRYREHLSEFLSGVAEITDWIDSVVTAWLQTEASMTDIGAFRQSAYVELREILQREVVTILYRQVHRDSTLGLTSANITELVRYIKEPRWGTRKELHGLVLTKKNGVVRFAKKEELV